MLAPSGRLSSVSTRSCFVAGSSFGSSAFGGVLALSPPGGASTCPFFCGRRAGANRSRSFLGGFGSVLSTSARGKERVAKGDVQLRHFAGDEVFEARLAAFLVKHPRKPKSVCLALVHREQADRRLADINRVAVSSLLH